VPVTSPSDRPDVRAEQPSSKADFSDLYDQPDPRGYYRALAALGYEVPGHGQRVFRRVLDALGRDRPTVLDLCCSYGVNAALLRSELDLDALYAHYLDDALTSRSSAEVAERDRRLHAEVVRDDAPTVLGLDVAGEAVGYAVDAGLLAAGFVEDLEHQDPSPALREALRGVDLLTVTGGIGYITERTFARVLGCTDPDRRPWLAALALRTVDLGPILDVVREHGLEVETLEDHTVVQRRFADDDERDYALRTLAARGIDPTGREAEGAYHAEVVLARPPADVGRRPIEQVLGSLRV
jgi:hypothetical protein